MSETVKLLEELSFRTLPALAEERYDGWVLRWSDGGSRRSNSANPMEDSSLPLPDKIHYCQEWFESRRAPAIFRLTPLAETTLDNALHDSGYRRSSPTAVMTAPLVGHRPDDRVITAEIPTDAWLRCIPAVGGDDPLRLERLRRQLMSSPGRNRFASITVAGEIAAIGMSLDFDGYTTIYHMNTRPRARRDGLARTILETLMAVGSSSGSSRAVLQVTEENVPALRLYRAAGFSTVYSYHYRELRPSDPS